MIFKGRYSKAYYFSHCIINETSLRFYDWNLRLVALYVPVDSGESDVFYSFLEKKATI